MKFPFWGVALIASLIVVGAAAYAEEATPDSHNSIYLMRMNRKNLENLQDMQEQRKKAVEAKKAEEEEKLLEQKKKAKVDKNERKTGHKVKSWQVLNR